MSNIYTNDYPYIIHNPRRMLNDDEMNLTDEFLNEIDSYMSSNHIEYILYATDNDVIKRCKNFNIPVKNKNIYSSKLYIHFRKPNSTYSLHFNDAYDTKILRNSWCGNVFISDRKNCENSKILCGIKIKKGELVTQKIKKYEYLQSDESESELESIDKDELKTLDTNASVIVMDDAEYFVNKINNNNDQSIVPFFCILNHKIAFQIYDGEHQKPTLKIEESDDIEELFVGNKINNLVKKIKKFYNYKKNSKFKFERMMDDYITLYDDFALENGEYCKHLVENIVKIQNQTIYTKRMYEKNIVRNFIFCDDRSDGFFDKINLLKSRRNSYNGLVDLSWKDNNVYYSENSVIFGFVKCESQNQEQLDDEKEKMMKNNNTNEKQNI